MNRIGVSAKELEEEILYQRQVDEMKKTRAEFMYNHLDYQSDRIRVRNRFLDQMNKKTTLKDIGETLDRLILDEKAEYNEYN